jgi:hypothetical protein
VFEGLMVQTVSLEEILELNSLDSPMRKSFLL